MVVVGENDDGRERAESERERDWAGNDQIHGEAERLERGRMQAHDSEKVIVFSMRRTSRTEGNRLYWLLSIVIVMVAEMRGTTVGTVHARCSTPERLPRRGTRRSIESIYEGDVRAACADLSIEEKSTQSSNEPSRRSGAMPP